MDKYEVIDENFGQGSFGKVAKVRHKASGKVMVWKVTNYGNMSEKEKQQLLNEVKILREIKAEHIVRCYDKFVDKENTQIYLVMELCEGGDLAQLLQRCKYSGEGGKPKYVSENFIWRLFSHVVTALYECHRSKSKQVILHRDLKPQNIFLDKNQRAKLGDFGFAKALGRAGTENDYAQTNLGSPYYMSPEQCGGQEYNEKSDIWSLGVILYEMAQLSPPFIANNPVSLALKIKEGKFKRIDSRYSDELMRVINWMLKVDPAERPDVEDLLNLPQVSVRLREGALNRNLHHSRRKHEEVKKLEEKLESKRQNVQRKEKEVGERETYVRKLEEEVEAMQKDLERMEMEQQNMLASMESLRDELLRSTTTNNTQQPQSSSMQQQRALTGISNRQQPRRNSSSQGPTTAASLVDQSHHQTSTLLEEGHTVNSSTNYYNMLGNGNGNGNGGISGSHHFPGNNPLFEDVASSIVSSSVAVNNNTSNATTTTTNNPLVNKQQVRSRQHHNTTVGGEHDQNDGQLKMGSVFVENSGEHYHIDKTDKNWKVNKSCVISSSQNKNYITQAGAGEGQENHHHTTSDNYNIDANTNTNNLIGTTTHMQENQQTYQQTTSSLHNHNHNQYHHKHGGLNADSRDSANKTTLVVGANRNILLNSTTMSVEGGRDVVLSGQDQKMKRTNQTLTPRSAGRSAMHDGDGDYTEIMGYKNIEISKDDVDQSYMLKGSSNTNRRTNSSKNGTDTPIGDQQTTLNTNNSSTLKQSSTTNLMTSGVMNDQHGNSLESDPQPAQTNLNSNTSQIIPPSSVSKSQHLLNRTSGKGVNSSSLTGKSSETKRNRHQTSTSGMIGATLNSTSAASGAKSGRVQTTTLTSTTTQSASKQQSTIHQNRQNSHKFGTLDATGQAGPSGAGGVSRSLQGALGLKPSNSVNGKMTYSNSQQIGGVSLETAAQSSLHQKKRVPMTLHQKLMTQTNIGAKTGSGYYDLATNTQTNSSRKKQQSIGTSGTGAGISSSSTERMGGRFRSGNEKVARSIDHFPPYNQQHWPQQESATKTRENTRKQLKVPPPNLQSQQTSAVVDGEIEKTLHNLKNSTHSHQQSLHRAHSTSGAISVSNNAHHQKLKQGGSSSTVAADMAAVGISKTESSTKQKSITQVNQTLGPSQFKMMMYGTVENLSNQNRANQTMRQSADESLYSAQASKTHHNLAGNSSHYWNNHNATATNHPQINQNGQKISDKNVSSSAVVEESKFGGVIDASMIESSMQENAGQKNTNAQQQNRLRRATSNVSSQSKNGASTIQGAQQDYYGLIGKAHNSYSNTNNNVVPQNQVAQNVNSNHNQGSLQNGSSLLGSPPQNKLYHGVPPISSGVNTSCQSLPVNQSLLSAGPTSVTNQNHHNALVNQSQAYQTQQLQMTGGVGLALGGPQENLAQSPLNQGVASSGASGNLSFIQQSLAKNFQNQLHFQQAYQIQQVMRMQMQNEPQQSQQPQTTSSSSQNMTPQNRVNKPPSLTSSNPHAISAAPQKGQQIGRTRNLSTKSPQQNQMVHHPQMAVDFDHMSQQANHNINQQTRSLRRVMSGTQIGQSLAAGDQNSQNGSQQAFVQRQNHLNTLQHQSEHQPKNDKFTTNQAAFLQKDTSQPHNWTMTRPLVGQDEEKEVQQAQNGHQQQSLLQGRAVQEFVQKTHDNLFQNASQLVRQSDSKFAPNVQRSARGDLNSEEQKLQSISGPNTLKNNSIHLQ